MGAGKCGRGVLTGPGFRVPMGWCAEGGAAATVLVRLPSLPSHDVRYTPVPRSLLLHLLPFTLCACYAIIHKPALQRLLLHLLPFSLCHCPSPLLTFHNNRHTWRATSPSPPSLLHPLSLPPPPGPVPLSSVKITDTPGPQRLLLHLLPRHPGSC